MHSLSLAPIVMLIGVALLVFFAVAEHRKKLKSLATAIIQEHTDELKLRRAQLTIRQSYGIIDDSRWKKEQAFFLQRVVLPKVGNVGPSFQRKVIAWIEIATEGFDSSGKSAWDANNTDPVAYERFVAQSLRDLGWDAHATQASGDQGIDVVATKAGVKLVVQCKLYSKPVGNAAVQEIVAGRLFERADYAAVISNAAFTKSAMQLASVSDVYLFHHDQLVALDAACMGKASDG